MNAGAKAILRIRREIARRWRVPGCEGEPLSGSCSPPPGKPSTLARLEEAASRAEVVLFGDFHAFPPAQENLLLLLKRIAARLPGVALALEAFPASADRVLEEFLRERCEEGELLRRTRLRARWPFDLRGLLRVLRHGRRAGIPVSGLDLEPGRSSPTRQARERHFVRRIEQILKSARARPLVVLLGEAHLDRVARLLPRRRVVRVFQLAAGPRADFSRARVVESAPGRFSILEESSILAARSFFDQIEGPEEPLDSVGGIAEHLATFLGLPSPDLSRLEVLGRGDPGVSPIGPPAELLRGRVVLRSERLPHECEGAALALRTQFGAPDGDLDPVHRFAAEVRDAAFGFLASRLVDPARAPLPAKACLARHFPIPARGLASLEAFTRAQAAWLSDPEASALPLLKAVRAAPASVRRAAARALGGVLGARLHRRLASGSISRRALRRLLLGPLPSADAAAERLRTLLRGRGGLAGARLREGG